MKSNNPGISGLSKEVKVGNYDNLQEVVKFSKENKIDFAFIGPEDPLGHGIVDELEKNNIPAVGPKKILAQLETSKTFTRDILKKYGGASAEAR